MIESTTTCHDCMADTARSLPEEAPIHHSSPISGTAIPDDRFEEELFRTLTLLRRQLAEKQRVPPYVIFNDKSLREMAQKLPEDFDSFRSISGVGKSKLEKYGRIFLDTICTYKRQMAG